MTWPSWDSLYRIAQSTSRTGCVEVIYREAIRPLESLSASLCSGIHVQALRKGETGEPEDLSRCRRLDDFIRDMEEVLKIEGGF
jgi:hypothetical protein